MPVSKKRDLYNDIRILQIVRAVVFLLGAVALVVFLHGHTIPVTGLYLTNDTLASQTQTVFVPALRSLFDAPVGYMAAIALLVSAGFGLHRYTKGQAAYKKEVKKTSGSLKWLDLGISSAIIIEIVALLSGVADPSVVKVCAGLIVITCALGWLADRQNEAGKKPEWSAYLISVLSGVLPWLIIGGSLAMTSIYGGVRLPWYSYALAGGILACFCALAINQLYSIRRYKSWKQYMFTERNYLIIDLATKIVFAGVLILGLKG